MKQALFAVLAVLTMAAPLCARADVDAAKALKIANGSDCLSCHAINNKVIGPAYRDVANKYKGDDSASTHLVEKVKNGGSGVWGRFPMPPHPDVSDQDLKAVIDWILAGAPSK